MRSGAWPLATPQNAPESQTDWNSSGTTRKCMNNAEVPPASRQGVRSPRQAVFQERNNTPDNAASLPSRQTVPPPAGVTRLARISCLCNTRTFPRHPVYVCGSFTRLVSQWTQEARVTIWCLIPIWSHGRTGSYWVSTEGPRHFDWQLRSISPVPEGKKGCHHCSPIVVQVAYQTAVTLGTA